MAGVPDNAAAAPRQWLEPLPCGSVPRLPNRILPGPMEGVTLGSFCTVMAQQRLVRCWITPFVRVSTGVPRQSRLRLRLEPYFGGGVPVIVQLMGNHIERLCATAARLAGLGAAGIDLNCGCPSRTVLRGGAGGAHLGNPDWIHDALVALRAACPECSISVKLRAGMTDPAELTGILPAVRAASPDFVVLHFRTVRELYRPVPDGWRRLALARELLPETILIGSGDLFTVADAFGLYARTGIDGVAPARGLLANPWLLLAIEAACRGESLRPPTEAEKIGLLREIVREALRVGARSVNFVVELGHRMFGVEHPLCERLHGCRDLACTVDVLRQ